MDPDAQPLARTSRVGAEARWFWWGSGWATAGMLCGGSFLFLHWKSELAIRAGLRGHSSSELGDAFAGSLTAAALGLPLTTSCALAFLFCWGRWLAEVRERR